MFPQFDILSTPLLILFIQGSLFLALLIFKYVKSRQQTDLMMILLIFAMIYDQVPSILSFMGWHESFPYTKINYFFIPLTLAFGPLIYSYLKSMLVPNFKLTWEELLHFVPIAAFFLYRIVILLHDSTSTSWVNDYEGVWQREFHFLYFAPILRLLTYSSQLLYLAFSLQLFFSYRFRIKEYFSSTYKIALDWLALFLTLYSFLFIYETLIDMTDALIYELSYFHKWWVQFFFSVSILFFGLKSYFTDFKKLKQFTRKLPNTQPNEREVAQLQKKKERLQAYFAELKPYLRSDLNLKEISEEMDWALNETSAVINSAFGTNFNEFVNRYRVEEVKKRLSDPANDHFSLLAIALDSGFNSKASFNRIFKQLEGQSPSQFKASSVE